MAKLTHSAVKAAIAAVGLTASRTDAGEWRVNYRGGSEATAYYTDDHADAIATAHAIAGLQRLEDATVRQIDMNGGSTEVAFRCGCFAIMSDGLAAYDESGSDVYLDHPCNAHAELFPITFENDPTFGC